MRQLNRPFLASKEIQISISIVIFMLLSFGILFNNQESFSIVH
jgi:hypothetical protein